MKLRIHQNSLRFRFDREEVERLNRGESLQASIQLGPAPQQALAYRVAAAPGGAPARVRLEQQTIEVIVSSEAVKAWFESADLAMASEERWGEYTLKLLLEKDMQRLNPKPGEESPGVYPNPLFGKARCDHP